MMFKKLGLSIMLIICLIIIPANISTQTTRKPVQKTDTTNPDDGSACKPTDVDCTMTSTNTSAFVLDEFDIDEEEFEWAIEALHRHNYYRVRHRQTITEHNQPLCRTCKWWSNKVLRIGAEGHSRCCQENLLGGGGKFSAFSPADAWYSEIEKFSWKTPEANEGVGHLLQIVGCTLGSICTCYTSGYHGRKSVTTIPAQYAVSSNEAADSKINCPSTAIAGLPFPSDKFTHAEYLETLPKGLDEPVKPFSNFDKPYWVYCEADKSTHE